MNKISKIFYIIDSSLDLIDLKNKIKSQKNTQIVARDYERQKNINPFSL